MKLKAMVIHHLIFQKKHGLNAESLPIVPQLSKCLKYQAVWGVLTDQMI